MKVLVIGANGQIGRHLMRMLHEDERYQPVAMVRKQEQAEAFKDQGYATVTGDLEHSVAQLAEVISGHDAIVFTAGSGGHTGADKTLLIDLDGAVKSMEAARQTGVRRYVMVSALQAHRREHWNEKIRHYYVAKHYADKELMNSGLDYTILRPGGLLNEPGIGKIALEENLERGTVPREDVARTIVAVLAESRTYGRAWDLISGETPIEAAVQNG